MKKESIIIRVQAALFKYLSSLLTTTTKKKKKKKKNGKNNNYNNNPNDDDDDDDENERSAKRRKPRGRRCICFHSFLWSFSVTDAVDFVDGRGRRRDRWTRRGDAEETPRQTRR